MIRSEATFADIHDSAWLAMMYLYVFIPAVIKGNVADTDFGKHADHRGKLKDWIVETKETHTCKLLHVASNK